VLVCIMHAVSGRRPHVGSKRGACAPLVEAPGGFRPEGAVHAVGVHDLLAGLICFGGVGVLCLQGQPDPTPPQTNSPIQPANHFSQTHTEQNHARAGPRRAPTPAWRCPPTARSATCACSPVGGSRQSVSQSVSQSVDEWVSVAGERRAVACIHRKGY